MITNQNLIFIIASFVFCFWKIALFYKNKERKKLNLMYIKFYDSINSKKQINALCHELNCFLYTESHRDYKLLKLHFDSQKPNKRKHKDFYKNECFIDEGFWWGSSLSAITSSEGKNKDERYIQKCTEQRKRFVLRLIEITKPSKIW
jgi:hypothetical protein